MKRENSRCADALEHGVKAPNPCIAPDCVERDTLPELDNQEFWRNLCRASRRGRWLLSFSGGKAGKNAGEQKHEQEHHLPGYQTHNSHHLFGIIQETIAVKIGIFHDQS
ncbi:MAG: hypothetical protein IPP94_06985 [Ignavibacteria bacterium]|nr:hypothetical protein [Ignavibacteria bacterium]